MKFEYDLPGFLAESMEPLRQHSEQAATSRPADVCYVLVGSDYAAYSPFPVRSLVVARQGAWGRRTQFCVFSLKFVQL